MADLSLIPTKESPEDPTIKQGRINYTVDALRSMKSSRGSKIAAARHHQEQSLDLLKEVDALNSNIERAQIQLNLDRGVTPA